MKRAGSVFWGLVICAMIFVWNEAYIAAGFCWGCAGFYLLKEDEGET